MKTFRETKRAMQRGATLTGYALTLATFAAAGLSAMTALEESSGEFLTETGNNIGEARPDQYELETTILASPDFSTTTSTTIPTTTTTAAPTTASTAASSSTTATTAATTTSTTAAPVYPSGDLIAEGALQPITDTMCLVVHSNNSVTQEPCDPATAPQFKIHERDDGTVTISLADGSCLGSTGGNASAVTNQACTESPNQLWQVTPSYTYPDGTQTYNLLNVGNQRCLDVSGNSTSAGAGLITWSDPQGTCKTSGSPNNHQFTISAGTAAPTADLSAEASEAALSGNFNVKNGRVGTDDNSQGSRNDGGADNTSSKATFTFTVAEAGNYKIKAKNLQLPDGDSDSFWVLVDGGPNADGYRFFASGSEDWVNNDPNGDVTVYLTPGTHTVTVALREDGARLGGLELVKV